MLRWGWELAILLKCQRIVTMSGWFRIIVEGKTEGKDPKRPPSHNLLLMSMCAQHERNVCPDDPQLP